MCVCVRLFYTGFSSDNRALSTHGQLTDCPADSHGVSDAAGCKEVVCVCVCVRLIVLLLMYIVCNWLHLAELQMQLETMKTV